MTDKRTKLELLASLLDKPLVKLNWEMSLFFGDRMAQLNGARVLDVGAGSGAISFYVACCGAREVISIEPEAAGSTSGVAQKYRDMQEALGLTQCQLLGVDFMEYQDEASFDIVMLHNSINHIREVRTDIRRDPASRKSQYQVVKHIANLLKPNGWTVLSDCSRRNFFADIGIRSPWPFVREIEWDKHQRPQAWKDLLREAGMGNFETGHYVPHKIRWFSWIIGSPLFSYFTYSWFVLRSQRGS